MNIGVLRLKCVASARFARVCRRARRSERVVVAMTPDNVAKKLYDTSKNRPPATERGQSVVTRWSGGGCLVAGVVGYARYPFRRRDDERRSNKVVRTNQVEATGTHTHA